MPPRFQDKYVNYFRVDEELADEPEIETKNSNVSQLLAFQMTCRWCCDALICNIATKYHDKIFVLDFSRLHDQSVSHAMSSLARQLFS